MGIFGGIEAGGTKFLCGIGTGPGDLTVVSFPTLSPNAMVEKEKERTAAAITRFPIPSCSLL
jgi:hypothetical protein